MNAESKINVHHSALVSLKAELLRKQTEVEQVKEKLYQNALLTHKAKKFAKHEKKETVSKRKKEDKGIKEVDIEDVKAHKKSKVMLQAKSKLYSQMTKVKTSINPNFLVDFKNKDDNETEDGEYASEPEYESQDHVREEDYPDDGEWVEYTDCFGRTRKCLKEDLQRMKERDDDLKEEVLKDSENEQRDRRGLFFEDRNPAKEPEIEIMRRKWEAQMEKLSKKQDIHYQDILFDEARTHGVGYYAFSQDETERKKQQEKLMNLRKETEKKQRETRQIQEIKDKIERNRLRVAKIRQRIRAGLPIDDLEEEAKEDEKKAVEVQETVVTSQESEKKEEQKKTVKSDDESKIDAFGELLAKRNKWYVMSQEEWVDKRREDRKKEFAPTYSNFAKGETMHFNDTEDSNVIGPLPPSGMESLPGTTDPSTSSLEDTVEAGLKFLRQQFENKSGT